MNIDEAVDPREFILSAPKTVAQVCENHGFRTGKREDGPEGSEQYTEHFFGIVPTRRIWLPVKSRKNFATSEVIDYRNHCVTGIYLHIRHDYGPGWGELAHTVEAYFMHTWQYRWVGNAIEEGPMAQILEQDMFDRLEALLQRFRGYDTDDLFDYLRRKKFLVRDTSHPR